MNSQLFAFHQNILVAQADTSDFNAWLLTQTFPQGSLLVFDSETGEQIDLPLSTQKHAPADKKEDVNQAKSTGPGRPKLGVQAREVTLLPQDWEWLSTQSGGASAALRRLVLKARQSASPNAAAARRSADACYRFINAIAGNQSQFEEAVRALYRYDAAAFNDAIRDWPKDIHSTALRLAHAALSVVVTTSE